MKLLQQIIEKANGIRGLIETGCSHEVIYTISEIEVLLMQVLAGIEDRADAVRDETRLLSESRQWMGRDHMLAMEQIDQLIECFEAIGRECAACRTAPGFEGGVIDEADEALLLQGDAAHWFG